MGRSSASGGCQGKSRARRSTHESALGKEDRGPSVSGGGQSKDQGSGVASESTSDKEVKRRSTHERTLGKEDRGPSASG